MPTLISSVVTVTKTLISLFVLLSAASARSEANLEATIDLSRLYGNLNAGVYKIDAEFKSTVHDEIDNIVVQRNTHYDDGIATCTTSVQAVVGVVLRRVTRIDGTSPWSKTDQTPITVSYGVSEDGTECTVPETDLMGTINANAIVGRLEQIILPASAPAPYKSVHAWIEVQRGGADVTLTAVDGSKNGSIKLKSLKASMELALAKIKSQGSLATYYVAAVEPGGAALSLGTSEYRLR